MNIIYFLVLGDPAWGEPYVESRGTKVWWRPHHTGDICRTRKTMNYKFFIYMFMPQCENINIFGYLGEGGGSILVHIYPLIYINLHVKYGSNLIRTLWVKILFHFFGVLGGPLHKTHGHRGHQNVSKCRPHHSGDICKTRENNWKPVFHIWAKT